LNKKWPATNEPLTVLCLARHLHMSNLFSSQVWFRASTALLKNYMPIPSLINSLLNSYQVFSTWAIN